jgi:quinohemoprotein ethanol dehydrogenase
LMLPILMMPCAGVAVAQTLHPVDDGVLKSAGKTGGEWLTYGLTQGETRYSTLDRINTGNVNRLAPAWSYDLGAGGGSQEDTPLFWNGTLYGITNWSVVFAVDAGTGKERWRWDPEVNQQAVFPRICCGVVNRGLAIYRGMILAPIIDGRLEALDGETGKVLWEARVAFPQDQNTLTMAPRVAHGKVIVGVSGGDYPTRGFFAAYDAMSGRLAWKFYTVPGDPSRPFENSAMKKAAQTWDGNFWKMGGGGAVWDGMAYDPDTDLLYVGTGNAEPFPEGLREQKGKDNLYVCSVLAVEVATGELRWYYQMVPDDSWDFDSVQQMILADLTIDGRPRKVIMQANKDGFFYVLDRITGKFISAQPFAQVTWAKGIDQRNGRPIVNPEAHYGVEGITISPGPGGAHNWSPMSFNPKTGLVYIPTSTVSTRTYASEPTYSPQSGSTSGTVRPPPKPVLPSPPAIGPAPLPGSGGRGALVAWNPVTQQMAWRTPGGGGIGGGTVTTAGNVVFQVINDGRLLAYSADKGEKLLEIDTGLHNGMGPPITYEMDGRQYVAVMGGTGTVRPRAGAAAPAALATATPPLSPKLLTFALDAVVSPSGASK